MPIGPWKNNILAKQAINEYTNQCGFSVIFRTFITPRNQKREGEYKYAVIGGVLATLSSFS